MWHLCYAKTGKAGRPSAAPYEHPRASSAAESSACHDSQQPDLIPVLEPAGIVLGF